MTRSARLFDVSTRPEEGTLAAGLRTLALTQVPPRFYLALQLALPASVQLVMWGWTRTAIALVAVSAFGIWALFEQHQRQSRDDDMANPAPGILFRVAQRIAATTASILSIGLLFESFVRLMSVAFKCPGCAG